MKLDDRLEILPQSTYDEFRYHYYINEKHYVCQKFFTFDGRKIVLTFDQNNNELYEMWYVYGNTFPWLSEEETEYPIMIRLKPEMSEEIKLCIKREKKLKRLLNI